jgi:hypothetical protein
MKTVQTQDQEIHHTKKWPAIVLPIILFVFLIASFVLFQLYRSPEALVGSSITGAQTLEKNPSFEQTQDPQIGIYMIKPSFSFADKYQLTDAFTALQREIRTFTEAMQECKQQDTVDSCLTRTLENPSYAAWSIGEDCETPEERLFYDVTEMFRTCLESADTDCACLGSFAASAGYPEGEYTLEVTQEDTGILFSLPEMDLSTTLSNAMLQEEGEESTATAYTVAVTAEGVLGQFGALEPSVHLYLYKEDAKTISVESQSSYSTYETTRSACTLSEKKIYKFCVQSPASVQIYDEHEESVVTKPITYTFAVEFK